MFAPHVIPFLPIETVSLNCFPVFCRARSAELAKLRHELEANGATLPPEKPTSEKFDSNCITPVRGPFHFGLRWTDAICPRLLCKQRPMHYRSPWPRMDASLLVMEYHRTSDLAGPRSTVWQHYNRHFFLGYTLHVPSGWVPAVLYPWQTEHRPSVA